MLTKRKLWFLLIFVFLFFLIKIQKPTLGLTPTNIPADKKPILLLSLTIDRPNSTIEINSIKKGLGFVPDYLNPNALDFLEVEIKTKDGKKRLITIPIPPKEVYAPSRKEGEILNYPPRKLEKFDYPIVLPYEQESILFLAKEFENEQGIKKATIEIKLPKSETQKVEALINGQLKPFNLESLSSEQLPTVLENYQIETIFDGNPSLTDPSQTLDIIFVSSGFTESEFDLFRTFSLQQADALIGFNSYPGKAPFFTRKNVIKVRRLVSNAIFHETNGQYANVRIPEVIETLTAIGIPFDQIAVVLDEDGRSFATLGGNYCVLFRTWGGPERSLLFAHEIAHSLGAVLDEYIEHWGASGELYYHDRNCKEDPAELWVANQPGGAYLGCEYVWNLYRPEENSLMRSIDEAYEFNAPSIYLLEQAFSAYTANGFALLIRPTKILSYLYLPSYQYSSNQQVRIINLGPAKVQFRGHFSPEVNWITHPFLEGTMPDYISFDIDYSTITSRGKYETTLVIEILTNPVITRRVPVIVVAGTSQEISSLFWSTPAQGQIIAKGNVVPVILTERIESPGWKKIEYYLRYPWAPYNNADIFDSRTINPLRGTLKTSSPDSPNYTFSGPGLYTLWAYGFPYFGPTAESNFVEVEIAAPTGNNCQAYWICTNHRINRECYRGATNCQAGGKVFCCPSQPYCPDGYYGNLNCDQNGLINNTDLDIIKNKWATASPYPTPNPNQSRADLNGDYKIDEDDFSILISNWKPNITQ